MTAEEFLLGAYASLMGCGISPDAVGRMSLELYLKVLQAAARRRGKREKSFPTDARADGKHVVNLHRGTIDEVW